MLHPQFGEERTGKCLKLGKKNSPSEMGILEPRMPNLGNLRFTIYLQVRAFLIKVPLACASIHLGSYYVYSMFHAELESCFFKCANFSSPPPPVDKFRPPEDTWSIVRQLRHATYENPPLLPRPLWQIVDVEARESLPVFCFPWPISCLNFLPAIS